VSTDPSCPESASGLSNVALALSPMSSRASRLTSRRFLSSPMRI
jgi:hypothetical protein